MGKLIRPVLESNVTGNCAADFTQKPPISGVGLGSEGSARLSPGPRGAGLVYTTRRLPPGENGGDVCLPLSVKRAAPFPSRAGRHR